METVTSPSLAEGQDSSFPEELNTIASGSVIVTVFTPEQPKASVTVTV